ncbi:hypothetical protein FJU30_14525 [Affinibrenneria salicis]|uniref:Uncharacterized protein n=1 Tax=Affinibrenneria salicis TaxID=2590031 RepID=A0A5J5FY75_9GAMM|nr:hypothetical protein [Affinibrenneria salicis]KAA8998899.1 hypothetical protein FJU30_14525 [Affinibrenneria salicis]
MFFSSKKTNRPPSPSGKKRQHSPSGYNNRPYSLQNIPAEVINSPNVLIGTLQQTEFNALSNYNPACSATHRYTIADKPYYRNDLNDGLWNNQSGGLMAGMTYARLSPGALTIAYLDKSKKGKKYISWIVQSPIRQLPPIDHLEYAYQNMPHMFICLALAFVSGYPVYRYDIDGFIFALLAMIFVFSAFFSAMYSWLIVSDLWAAITKSRHEVRLYQLLISAGERYEDK